MFDATLLKVADALPERLLKGKEIKNNVTEWSALALPDHSNRSDEGD
jgi:hypothetical protein